MMDVANGSAAEKAEAHLRRPITGGKVCLGFSRRQLAFTYYSFPHGPLENWHLLSLFASHFHSLAFRSSYQQHTFLFTVQVDFHV